LPTQFNSPTEVPDYFTGDDTDQATSSGFSDESDLDDDRNESENEFAFDMAHAPYLAARGYTTGIGVIDPYLGTLFVDPMSNGLGVGMMCFLLP
jgi:hypothetical protein